MVDSDDEVCFVIVLFFFHICGLGVLIEGNSSLRGRQSSGSEPDKGIIEPWRLG